MSRKSPPLHKPAARESAEHGQRGHKVRLDLLLVERGTAPSRERAQAMILAGEIRVNGQPVAKSGALAERSALIEIQGEPLRYASRAGSKLEGALEDFGLNVEGKICLDVGASAGGFTDCLLQQGAKHVYAVDVNVSQLAWKLQKDARVTPIKRNARYLHSDDIAGKADIVTVDVSFISVGKLLGAVAAAAKLDADFLILVKPQFELERANIGKGGIVRDPELHQRAIERVRAAATNWGLQPVAVRPSRLPGAEGNLEFFLHARLMG